MRPLTLVPAPRCRPCAGMKLVREATEAAEAKKEKEKEAGERWGTGGDNEPD